MDGSLVVAQVGTLLGVSLGAALTGRYQRDLIRQGRLDELRREKRLTCARSLAAQRRFRKYIQSSDAVTVTQVPVADRPDEPTPLQRGAEQQAEVYESAMADFEVLVDDEDVRAAHAVMRRTLIAVMRARSDYEPGAIPDAIVKAAGQAENAFAARVRQAYPS